MYHSYKFLCCEGLGEAYDGDIAFASSLETFGGGHDDPISIAVGGPVMTKFTIALREIGTYKEVLRSQVEHMLNDRLANFVNSDLQDVKEVRKRFDKATLHYDQVREKFMSLKKSTRIDIVTETEEDLHNARSAFEQARFNLVTALSNIEAKKKFEFLEAVSGTMDAHLRYFKQGYELLHQMEPYIHQVLTYAQQSRERTNYEQSALAERMEEFRKQIELENQRSFNDIDTSPSGDGIQAVGRSSHKMIEAVMQSTMKGKVQTIKQGYLLKRSSNLRGDWKRRFFVLDSRGMLYYYRKQWSKPAGPGNQQSIQRAPSSSEHVAGLIGRLLSSGHNIPQEEKSVTHHTVNLLTSTIKVDAEQTDLRFCFRIISPTKNYTLQAENAVDRMDWIDKITAVIASLLNSQLPEQVGYSQRVSRIPRVSGHQGKISDTNSWSSSSDLEQSTANEYASVRSYVPSCQDTHRGMQGHVAAEQQERPLDTLRKVPGNDVCADCGCHDPDWASLNLGILLCIECSGVHRNLGVHISKVRSLTLDVRVWELSVISLFQSLGNMYANSIWEELLETGKHNGDAHNRLDNHQQMADIMSINKPKPRDALSIKEKFIQAKYAEKQLVSKERSDLELPSVDFRMWEAVQRNDKQMAYCLLIMSDANIATNYEQAKSGIKGNSVDHDISESSCRESMQHSDSGTSSPSIETHTDDYIELEGGLKGCSLLHLACHTGDLAMLELLLQYGADVNAQDYYGRTPLHHCISKGNNQYAKLLIRRGASAMIADGRGKTPLQRAMEMGAIPDDELFLLLSEHN
ncbi:ADP-ribosylation factor GTPase-activating protein AGD3 isoform X2 [Cryptomeria japonica]|uniref:ADP-ribosylation factor GTPase-activating protein AGD3 isoform X2 n=1 Tax=Cryptomeria japonica TaxID=3369 RepID=UPI0027DA0B83|nr:ADP-ribosylation factor GTPase-activating protein AGD3 isoform X2 [Cryptomeria japonica]